MRKIVFKYILILAFATPCLSKSLPIFATYVADYDQERKAEALIKSIRLFAGTANNAEILVFIDKSYNYSDKRLDPLGVKLISIDADSKMLALPYTNKAYAAAQAENLSEGKTDQLYWFDPETIVVSELQDLQLSNGKQIALRPVFLPNKVAIKYDQASDFFWTEIYKQAKIDLNEIIDVKTVLEETSIKAYFNCGVVSVNPSLKIFRKWADLQTEMLNKPDFLKMALVDVPHQIFFHQAVFTAAVLSTVTKNQIQWLSLACAYPLNLYERMPASLKINNLNQVNSMILEDVWNKNPKWLDVLTIDPLVKEQLRGIIDDYYRDSVNK